MDGSNSFKEGKEAAGIRVEKLSANDLSRYASQIEALKYDALNPDENLHREGTQRGRREEVKEERRDMSHVGSRESAYVLLDGERVIGFLTVNRISSTEAEVGELWTAVSGRPQRDIARKLLSGAKDHLSPHHVQHLLIQMEEVDSRMENVSNTHGLEHYIKTKDSPEEKTDEPFKAA